MHIRKARSTEAEELSTLALLSKAYWGYTQEQLDSWREDLRITPAYLRQHTVYVGEVQEKLIGFYAYCSLSGSSVELDFLFVSPTAIGKGYGQRLLQHCLHNLQQQDYQTVELLADPHAASFYTKNGFTTVALTPSSIPGRQLPKMTYNL